MRNQHTSGKGKVRALQRIHVDIKPALSGDFLHLPLRTNRPPQSIQATYDLEHGCQRHSTSRAAQARMRTLAIDYVRVDGTVETHAVGGWVDSGVSSELDEGDEGVVARREFQISVGSVRYAEGLAGATIGAECSVESCRGGVLVILVLWG